MNFIYLILLLPLFVFPTKAQGLEEGVLEISEDHHVVYRYQKPQPGKPTIVLLNGLIWDLDNWKPYIEDLVRSGYGVLVTAYSTQPESLQTLDQSPYFFRNQWTPFGLNQVGITTQDLVDETMAVVDSLGIDKFTLASLSYGSIPASEIVVQHRQRVENLILMAPAMMTSGRFNAYGASRHAYYSLLGSMGNPATDYFYDLEIYSTLSMLITPLQYQFSGVAFPYFFSGVYQMARSSKWFDLKDYVFSDLPPTYLFLASNEDPALLADQEKFWGLLEQNQARRSKIVFNGAFHAIPGSAPKEASHWTSEVLSGGEIPREINVAVQDKNSTTSEGSQWTEVGVSEEQGMDASPEGERVFSDRSEPRHCSNVFFETMSTH